MLIYLFAGIEFNLNENEKIKEYRKSSTHKSNKKKLDKKRSHKVDKGMDECDRESLMNEMKEEIDEMRKREIEKTKELEQLKKKIDEQSKSTDVSEPKYALEFDKQSFLNRGFIESAKWIKDVLTKKHDSENE
jgi:hypothetical protein